MGFKKIDPEDFEFLKASFYAIRYARVTRSNIVPVDVPRAADMIMSVIDQIPEAAVALAKQQSQQRKATVEAAPKVDGS